MADVPATTGVSVDVWTRFGDVGNMLFAWAGAYRLQVVDAAGRSLGMAVVVALP